MPNWLGDIVMATSAIEALHRTDRYALHLLIRRPWDELFRHDPRLESVTVFEDRGVHLFSTASTLRARGYPTVVDFTHSMRSRLLWKLAGIPVVVRERARMPDDHQVMRYLSVIRPLIGGSPVAPCPPTLFYSDLKSEIVTDHLLSPRRGERIEVRGVDRGNRNLPPSPQPSPASGGRGGIPEILIFPAAAYGPAKMWSTSRYVDLLTMLTDRGWSIRLLGTAVDREFLDELVEKSKIQNPKSKIEACPGLPLNDLMRLIVHSSAVISCDSGAAHLAAALGKPVLVLFFSTDPYRTAPVGHAVRVISAAVPCRPCFLRTCPIDYLCRDAVTPHDIDTQLNDIFDVPAKLNNLRSGPN